MSAYSTVRITRSKARELILQKLMGGMSDSEMERILDDMLESALLRAQLVSDHSDDNDNELLPHYITGGCS